MTRNLGTWSSGSDTSSGGEGVGGCGGGGLRRGDGHEHGEAPAHSLSLRKLTGGVRRGEAGITSSLLGPSAGTPLAGAGAGAGPGPSAAESRHARRARVTRSWNGGYGTLLEGGLGGGGGGSRVELAPVGGPVKKASAGNVPQQQFLRTLQRASSTILTKASSAVNNNNSCSHNHNIGASHSGPLGCEEPLQPHHHHHHHHHQHHPHYHHHHHHSPQQSAAAGGQQVETADAARRGRIDVLLMPSLKSLVSRRPAAAQAAGGGPSARGGGGGGGGAATSGSTGAGASAAGGCAPSSSADCDMGGSSSSSVAAGNSHHHLKSKSAAAMVPLMKREPSCASLGPSIRVRGSSDSLGGLPMAGPDDDCFAGGATSDSSSSPSCSQRGGVGGGGGAGAGGGRGTAMRKCETVLALSNLGAMLRSASSSRTTMHVEPLKPVNRLRVPPQSPLGGSTSRMCSRCSSLLSMASSSRYSLNTTGGFVQCGTTPPGETQTLLCKLCLVEVPVVSTCEILQCGCCFCKDCMKSYIEFEIQEGAYDISCPDAQCDKQGVISMSEIENLVSVELVEKHRKFRLNREVDLDVNRTWCPRAGCETVCSVCPTERCQPQSVHCPTCTSDFCSNCKNPWHPGLTCEENSQRLAKEGMPDNMEPGIPFDSDLIKCCPMCNVPIEKDEGCAQMMCKRCKHVFCWYCLASLDDDFLLRHYDKGPCKNKLGHSRASVIWHRTQVIGIFAGFGILLLVASPLLLLAAPCIVCCKCRICSGGSKLDSEDEMPEESAS